MKSSSLSPSPRTALIHEWLVDWGGSESVTAAILESMPDAELHALFDFLSATDRLRLGGRFAQTTFLQHLPFMRSRFWYWLWLMPHAVERLDLRSYELIVSSSHAFAKGVITTAEQCHISYVHSPMRYAWDLYHDYLDDYGLQSGFRGLLAQAMFHRLRQWDRGTANQVDFFIANSRFVAHRIWRTYRRPAAVLHPPVEVEKFDARENKEDFYVTVSRLVSYKRIDLIVDAFAEMPHRRLVVIGEGPEAERIRGRATPNVTFLEYQPDPVMIDYLQRARAFIFAAVEDFGIAPVEAQAAGTPVIALGRGGALETVVGLDLADRPTGVFFGDQTVPALKEAIQRFEAHGGRFSHLACRANAERYSRAHFIQHMRETLPAMYSAWRDGRARQAEQDFSAAGQSL